MTRSIWTIAVLTLGLVAACQGGGSGADGGADGGPDAAAVTCSGSDKGECCRADDDCSGSATCAPPGAPRGCGICLDTPGDCTDDETCDPGSTGMICEPIACSCSGQRQCVAGCLDSAEPCPEGTRCGANSARCESLPCSEGCPVNFECGELTRCVRADCLVDRDCPGGVCVLGACYASLGECRLPVP